MTDGAGRAAGVIRSASGATAHVAARASTAFQCFVDKLERQATRFASWAAGAGTAASACRCNPAALALDINQRRSVTPPRMPHNEIALADTCGLFRGWADSGHFQLGGWGGRPRY
jgi:hypothetical protein